MSLINIEGSSQVVIKLLSMIEKSVGWIVSPKGNQKDFHEGIQIYKESIKNDQSLSGEEKGARISTARKDLRQYINQRKIIENSIKDIDENADFENIDPDWLAYFFEYAKNISNEEIQLVWSKLLANKINGNQQMTKKLIHILSVIEGEDIDVFCKICSMTFDNVKKEKSKYPFIYIGDFPSYYNSKNIRRYHLHSLADLGLIEYDIANGFVLPATSPTIKYDGVIYNLSSENRITTGNIRLTTIGATLLSMTERIEQDDFIPHCKRVWESLNIQYETIEQL